MNIVLEHVPCDLCGNDEYRLRYRKPDNWLWLNQYEFSVVECTRCGLVFVNPRPTQDSMKHYYPEQYHYNRNGEEWKYRYEIETEYVGRLREEKVLDIGCARGEFLSYLIDKYPGIEAYGQDYYSEGVDSQKIRFVKKNLAQCDYPDRYFDLATAWAVFEHLHHPGDYFAETSRVLKPNGRFFFLVTNSESLYGTRAYIEDVPRHTYHYSESTLGQYADKYGFHFKDCHYDDRIWDGRGIGTFHHGLMAACGVTWGKIRSNEINRVQKIVGTAGAFIDSLVFSTHWESKLRRSGVIVAEFEKK